MVRPPAPKRRAAAFAIAKSAALVSFGEPASSPRVIVTVAYREMATLQTKPPISSEYGGTSVQPPPKSMRVGARVTMVSDTQLDDDRTSAVIDPAEKKCGVNVFRAPRIANRAIAAHPHRAWLLLALTGLMVDITHYLNDCKFILVSNREPYEHMRGPGGIEIKQPAGGLVTALDPTMRRTHGTWVAWGSGTADRDVSDETGRVAVPPGEECYTVRRVWLNDADINGYYHGFSNRALWPLCHMLIQHFEFRTEYWERYRTVNLRFAHAVADEAERCTGRAMAWIQDYHFALAGEYLRAMRPSLFIHQFWHIPFPPADILRLLPAGTHEAVLRGLLGNDLVEFQIDRYAVNFLDCVEKFVTDARVDHVHQTVTFRDRVVHVGAFPISIDVEGFEAMASSADSQARVNTLRERYAKGTRQLGVCVDRIDYTKGIPERIRALETLWAESPELRERFTFIFVCTPSRTDLPAYNALDREVVQSVIAINERFGT